MLEVPIYEDESNVPTEIAGLQLAGCQMVDVFEPGAGWVFRYEARFSHQDWAGANVFMYDHDDLVRGGTRTDRAEAEYERSASSFLNLAERERYQDLQVVRSGYAVDLVPRSGSVFDRVRSAFGSQPDRPVEPTQEEIEADPLEDPGWWWSIFTYRDGGEELITHLTLRVDATMFQKVLYTHTTTYGDGHEAVAAFAKGWRQGMIDFINAPFQ